MAPAPAPPPTLATAAVASSRSSDDVAAALRGRRPAAILLGGRRAARGRSAAPRPRSPRPRVRDCYARCSPRGCERGAGLPAVERLAYLPEIASVQLAGLKRLCARRHEGASVVLRVPRQEELPGPGRLPGARARIAVRRCGRIAERVGGVARGRSRRLDRRCGARPARASDRRVDRREGVSGDRRRAARGRDRLG